MKKYFLYNNGKNLGPFDLSELRQQKITAKSMIWSEGMTDWQPANSLIEIQDVIETILPPPPPLILPDEEVNTASTYAAYDYSQVEDIGGVNYRYAMYLTGGYLALHILFKQLVCTSFGIILSTALAAGIWWYFRQYFVAMRDMLTAKWIKYMMSGIIVFGLFTIQALSVGFASTALSSIAGAFFGAAPAPPSYDMTASLLFMRFGIIGFIVYHRN